jgi:hypothetical protein
MLIIDTHRHACPPSAGARLAGDRLGPVWLVCERRRDGDGSGRSRLDATGDGKIRDRLAGLCSFVVVSGRLVCCSVVCPVLSVLRSSASALYLLPIFCLVFAPDDLTHVRRLETGRPHVSRGRGRGRKRRATTLPRHKQNRTEPESERASDPASQAKRASSLPRTWEKPGNTRTIDANDANDGVDDDDDARLQPAPAPSPASQGIDRATAQQPGNPAAQQPSSREQ